MINRFNAIVAQAMTSCAGVLLSCFATMTVFHVLKFVFRYLALSIVLEADYSDKACAFLGS